MPVYLYILYIQKHGETPCLPRIKDAVTSTKSAGRRRQQTSRASFDSSAPKVGKAKQLKVTHRLEYAMDILDKVKVARGDVTTTPRMRVKTIDDPLLFVEGWLDSWDKEFINTRTCSDWISKQILINALKSRIHSSNKTCIRAIRIVLPIMMCHSVSNTHNTVVTCISGTL